MVQTGPVPGKTKRGNVPEHPAPSSCSVPTWSAHSRQLRVTTLCHMPLSSPRPIESFPPAAPEASLLGAAQPCNMMADPLCGVAVLSHVHQQLASCYSEVCDGYGPPASWQASLYHIKCGLTESRHPLAGAPWAGRRVWRLSTVASQAPALTCRGLGARWQCPPLIGAHRSNCCVPSGTSWPR